VAARLDPVRVDFGVERDRAFEATIRRSIQLRPPLSDFCSWRFSPRVARKERRCTKSTPGPLEFRGDHVNPLQVRDKGFWTAVWVIGMAQRLVDQGWDAIGRPVRGGLNTLS
jgi:hypothetical protein